LFHLQIFQVFGDEVCVWFNDIWNETHSIDAGRTLSILEDLLHCCEILLWDPAVRSCCGILLWDPAVRACCEICCTEILLWDPAVRSCCEILLWDPAVRSSLRRTGVSRLRYDKDQPSTKTSAFVVSRLTESQGHRCQNCTNIKPKAFRDINTPSITIYDMTSPSTTQPLGVKKDNILK